MNKIEIYKTLVENYAQFSHCSRLKVAAALVKNDRVLCTGINGTPPGYINCDAHFRYLNTELNEDAISFKQWQTTDEFKNLHHLWSDIYEIHAEQSLLSECTKLGISLVGGTVYSTLEPCNSCLKLLISAGVSKIVYFNEYERSSDTNMQFCKDNSVELVKG